MEDAICRQVMTVLQNDPDLYAGGNAYASGFLGVRREGSAEEPMAGYVNLYDSPYRPGSTGSRPAVYCGDFGEENSDRRDGPSIGITEHRMLSLPLVVVAIDPSPLLAVQKRRQLAANVRMILRKHVLEDGYWYDNWLEAKSTMTRDTGGGDTGIVQSLAKLYFRFRYTETDGRTA